MLDTPSWKKAILEYREEYNNNPDYPYLSKVFGKTPRELLNFANEKGVYPTSPIEESDIESSVDQDSLEDSFETNSLNLQDYVEDVQEEFLESPDKNTHYSTETHEIFHFKGESLPIAIPKKTWAAIVRDYSDYGPMGRTTVKEIAIKYSIPQKTLERCLRSAGQYHHSAPFTPERIEEEDVEPLSDQALEYKEHQILSKIEAKRADAAIKENPLLKERLYNRSMAIRELTEEFIEAANDMPSATYTPKTPIEVGNRYHAPLADVHAGLHVWGKELWSNDYNIDYSSERIKDHAIQSADWIASQGDCKEIYVSDLGDLYHGLTGATEGGTILQQDTRAKKVWRETAQAKIEAIQTLLEVSPSVKVISTPGNHDHLFNFVFYEALEMYFNNDDRVEFLTTVTPQSYFIIDSTLHLILHGTKIGQLTAPKSKASIEVIARQTAGKDYSKVKKIKAYVGHLHNSQVETQGGHMELIRLPAACETDDYAQGLGFYHEPGARVFSLDDSGDIAVEKRILF